MLLLRLALVILFAALPARAAEEVVAGLSQARVSITTDFSGSEILVFGAVKRSAPAPEGPPLHVIVSVSGPSHPVIVRKKDRRFGIWINTEAAEIAAAPAFYAVSTTGPLNQILSRLDDLRFSISTEMMIRGTHETEAGVTPGQLGNFPAALLRIRRDQGLYQMHEGAVELTEDTLFRTGIALPANLVEGDYVTRIFLTRGGEVIDAYDTTIGVRKVGLERWIYSLAHNQPLIYGLLSLVIAIAAGWAASTVFRYFMRG